MKSVNFAIGSGSSSMLGVQSTAHATQLTEIPQRDLAQFEAANRAGRLVSVKLADGSLRDFTTENQSKYLGFTLQENQAQRGKQILERARFPNVPMQHGAAATRGESMVTVAQEKDSMVAAAHPGSSQKVSQAEQSKYYRKSNWAPGYTRPEHHEVSMIGIPTPAGEAPKGKSPQKQEGRERLQNSGKGVVNPNAAVSAGNIGSAPHEKYDFKTVNMERLRWIQPQARTALAPK